MSEKESITVKELIDNDSVPVGVRFWLEQYRDEGDEALDRSNINQDYNTLVQARLIYDVLNSKYASVDRNDFPEAARDYIEEYLYQLCEGSDIHIWKEPDIAVHALSILLDCVATYDTDATTTALEVAIRQLTTRRERRSFLRGSEEEGNETREDRDYKAAMKLSRYLADPRTPQKLKNQIGSAVCELANITNVQIDHPAIVERAVSVMFEAIATNDPQLEEGAERTRFYLLAMLDELPDMPKGGAE